ncbi:hypothetical protein E1287_32175 [Actinomadura sp. KC06]|nr:hypothetical protein E1287_32175 [Actinomadura sp. KC06]
MIAGGAAGSDRASLPLSRQTLTYATGVIRRHRASIGSKGRALPPGAQALMVLVYLRKGETFAELATGFGVLTSTAWRYTTESIELLAARAPKLPAAVGNARRGRLPYLILDGTLVASDRVAADRPFYLGKHHKHGVNLQVIAAPDGSLLWVSGPLRGRRCGVGARSEGRPDLGRHPRAGCHRHPPPGR